MSDYDVYIYQSTIRREISTRAFRIRDFVAQNTDCGCTLAEPLPLLICQLQLIFHHLKPALINVYEVIHLIEQKLKLI